MQRLIMFLMLTCFLTTISCGKNGGSSSGNSVQDQTASSEIKTEDDDSVNGSNDGNAMEMVASTVSSTSSVPAMATSFKTNVSLMNLTSTQAAKYNQAIAIVKKVVATSAFRSKVLSFRYNGATQFSNNNGKTNAQIYQSILDAAEKLKPVKNNTMDLGVKMYYEASSVVGYTSPSISYINVNTKFFNTYAANQVAGNLFHEWLHKIGYDHDSASTARRPYSVPYAVGYIVRDLGKNFL